MLGLVNDWMGHVLQWIRSKRGIFEDGEGMWAEVGFIFEDGEGMWAEVGFGENWLKLGGLWLGFFNRKLWWYALS